MKRVISPRDLEAVDTEFGCEMAPVTASNTLRRIKNHQELRLERARMAFEYYDCDRADYRDVAIVFGCSVKVARRLVALGRKDHEQRQSESEARAAKAKAELQAFWDRKAREEAKVALPRYIKRHTAPALTASAQRQKAAMVKRAEAFSRKVAAEHRRTIRRVP